MDNNVSLVVCKRYSVPTSGTRPLCECRVALKKDTKAVRWDETAFGVKQWQAIRAVVPTTQYFTTHSARHCFTPNRVSSHITSFVPIYGKKRSQDTVSQNFFPAMIKRSTQLDQTENFLSKNWKPKQSTAFRVIWHVYCTPMRARRISMRSMRGALIAEIEKPLLCTVADVLQLFSLPPLPRRQSVDRFSGNIF